jgi:predicted ATPase
MPGANCAGHFVFVNKYNKSMQSKLSVKTIGLLRFLSFGPETVSIACKPLNILVGANGSGKSNFVEAFRILKSTPTDLLKTIADGGGVKEWQWKGRRENSEDSGSATLIVAIRVSDDEEIRHILAFNSSFSAKLQIQSETISKLANVVTEEEPGRIYQYSPNGAMEFSLKASNYHFDETGNASMSLIPGFAEDSFNPSQSILSQRNEPRLYPELFLLNNFYKSIRIYSESMMGRQAPARRPQDAALDSSFLFEDYSNLALVLNELQNYPSVKRDIIKNLKLFYERVEDIITRVQGGTVQIFFQEEGLIQTVPATRLSDGTLRYLCLLVLLLHPTPPPLICIEEPELGMHPDVIPVIADLLIEASQRTQLIITTHSDLLVSAIGVKQPEAIVVCDRTNQGTTLTRLEPDKLKDWLADYSLGEVWLKGAIGGTRY